MSIKISLRRVGIIVSAFLAVSCPVLKAEVDSKAEAVKKALAQAEKKAEAVTQASVSSTEPTYRQKLGAVITTEKPEEEFAHEIDSYVRYMPSGGLKDQPGKIGVIESATEYSYQFKAWGKLPIELALGYGYININKKEDVPLSLPNQLTTLATGVQVTLPFFKLDKTYIRFRVEPSFLSDDWNTASSSFRIPSMCYGIYQPNEKWTFIAGVAVFPSNESAVSPIAGFIYQPNDKLTFNIIPSRPTISYDITEKFNVFAEGGMMGDEFRVSKDEFPGKTLIYNNLRAGGGLKYSINKYIDASFSAGYVFNRYLKYRDSLGKVNLKNDLYTEFRIEAGI